MTRPPETEMGFTIIELMIALLIFAMLSAAGIALLAFGVRAQAAAVQRLDAVASEQRLSNLIAADLAQALPRIARGQDGATLRAFTGNDGRSVPLIMGYVRGGWTNPDNDARPTIQRVDLVFEGGRLERRAYAAADGGPVASTIVLADGLDSIATRYRKKEGGWQPRWDNGKLDSLPVAAEVTLKRKSGRSLRMLWAVGVRP